MNNTPDAPFRHGILAGFAIFFMTLVSLNAAAQYRVAGTVFENNSGKSLPGAHVILEKTGYSSVADDDGAFLISKVRKGTYSLSVSFIGYKTYKSALVVLSDTILRIGLDGTALLGEEVNISATRAQKNTPAAFSVLTARELQPVNLGRDVTYLIQGTPSAIVTSDAGNGIGYTSISIRGTDLTRINVTVNSIPLNDPESQGVWFVDLPDLASSAGNIQIQRGVGTSTNGAGAFGASINFMTTDMHQDPYGELDLSAGSYRSLKTTLKFGSGMISDRFSVDGRLSYIHSDGYIDRAFSTLKSYYLSGGYYGPNTTLKLVTFSGYEQTYQAWEGVPKDSLATNRTYNPAGAYYDRNGVLQYYENQTDNYQQDHYQVIFSQRLSKVWNLNLALHYTRGKGYYENYEEDEPFSDYGLADLILGGDTITETNLVNRKMMDNYFYGLTFSTNYNIRDKVKLTLGGAWNRYYGKHFGKVIWAEFASNGDNERNYYYNTGLKTDFNIFLKAAYQLNKIISLSGDLQYRNVNYTMEGLLDNQRTVDQTHRFNFFNPKVGLFARFNDNHETWLSFGVANREPSRNNYKDADPGKIPTNETLYDLEAGYQFRKENLSLSANLYYMYYRNQLALTGEINNVGEAVMVNVPKSYRTGIEIAVGLDFLQKKMNWAVNVTLSRNKIKDFTHYIDVYDADWNYLGQDSTWLGETDLSFSPAINASTTLSWKPVKQFSAGLNFKYIGKQYIDNTSSDMRSLDAYLTSGFVARYTIKTRLFSEIIFNLNINNLLNLKYETNAWTYPWYVDGSYNEVNGFFPQATINFMFGITIRI